MPKADIIVFALQQHFYSVTEDERCLMIDM